MLHKREPIAGFVTIRPGDSFALRVALRAMASGAREPDPETDRIARDRLRELITEAELVEDRYASPVPRGV